MLPRKLKDIEGQLRSLYGRSRLQRVANYFQDDEDVLGLLEDLQEVISNYEVLLRSFMTLAPFSILTQTTGGPTNDEL